MPKILRCRVTEILEHGERVYSLFMKPESPAPRFRPGQYLNLALDEYVPGNARPDSRSFSIASSPAERQLLRITYAVKGQFSTRMEAELHVGRQVWVEMPYGEFTINDEEDVCLLAGGTGVTAFTAFLAGLPADHPYNVYFFYGVRCPDLLIYRSLVDAAARRSPNLQVHFLVEQDAAGTDFLPGLIDAGTVFALVPKPLSLTYYLAGPPVMIQAITAGLRQRGLAEAQIVADAWG
jgi:toluene monooxygenase electron transfer component